jgi:hypothetical protein
MKLLLVVTVSVALIVGLARADERREAIKRKIHDYRVESQDLHIDKLVHEVEELEKEYRKLSPIPHRSEVHQIKARVWNLEEHECPEGENHVPCGGPVPECISPLFVCDGIKDCKNGRDESSEVCSDAPYKVGATLTGITSWTDCFTHSPHMTVVTITANYKPAAYPSQVYVKAVASFEVDEHSHLVQSHNMKGYWSPGRRALALVPDSEKDEEAKGYGIYCKFNLGSNDVANCKIGMSASKHVCATFRGARP